MPAAAAILPGNRLHLHHGPIDLVIGAESERARAFAAARARFATVLDELVAELPRLRAPHGAQPWGNVARRMTSAVQPLSRSSFVTPMAAVAGAVADEVLAAMTASATLARAYVNDGGDVALHLAPGARFCMAVAGPDGAPLGRVEIRAEDGVRGVATSGQGGRSLSLGVADAVTVLARSAAEADAAATLIANAVDLPGHRAVRRERACDLDPDSDLGQHLVATHVGLLTDVEVARALARGARAAEAMRRDGLIHAAALFLRGRALTVGPERLLSPERRPAHA